MESINPKDFSEIDLSTVEYFTLKNGNMILLDETVPEKKNKVKTNKNEYQKNKNFNLLAISETIDVCYKSLLKINSKSNNNNKDNYSTSIFKNDNFCIINSFNDKNKIKNIFNKKYNKIDLNSLRKKLDEIDKLIIDSFLERMKIVKYIINYEKKNNIPIFDSLRENELLLKRKEMVDDISLHNDIEDLFKLILKISKDHQKIERNNLEFKNKNDFQEYNNNIIGQDNIVNKINKLNLNNINPINNPMNNINDSNHNKGIFMNISNNNISNKESFNYFNSGNKNESKNESNTNRDKSHNYVSGRRTSRLKTFEKKDKLKEKVIKGRNNSNLIKAVCSLNISSDNPRNINLIAKFNNLVDKLNDQKYKNYKEKELQDNEKANKKKEFYNIENKRNVIKSNINNVHKKYIRRNIFNICENESLKECFGSNKEKTPKKIIYNKTRIYNIINESKLKISELKYNRTFRNNNKFLKYKKNCSSIVLPSNNYY